MQVCLHHSITLEVLNTNTLSCYLPVFFFRNRRELDEDELSRDRSRGRTRRQRYFDDDELIVSRRQHRDTEYDEQLYDDAGDSSVNSNKAYLGESGDDDYDGIDGEEYDDEDIERSSERVAHLSPS